jgi:phosphoglycerate dehydrogenase-like enzyme
VQILFCGDTFPASRDLLRRRLPSEDQIWVWRDRSAAVDLSRVDVLIPMMFRIDAGIISAGHFRLIQQWGSGLEGIDLESARQRGIAVASVPSSGNNAESVAEHALLLILSLLRQLPAAQANIRAGVLGSPMGRMLAGRTVCLYGLGSTALSLARRLRALHVKLIGITRDPAAPKLADFQLAACYSAAKCEEALAQCDILVLCTRLAKETRGLFDARAFGALRPGAYLINAARGALVDYDALHSALSSGRLAGAGLDVYWEEPISPTDPLLSLPNVIATPHIAGVTEESYDEIADAVAANIARLRAGEPLRNCVI